MLKKIILKYSPSSKTIELTPPASKSESNRVLMINALAKQKASKIHNISTARDSQIMQRLLENMENMQTLDIKDAGTPMRFLTAFAAIGESDKTLTGSLRMQERPILPLTAALVELGAEVQYLKNEGFPPILVKPIETQKKNSIDIISNISSQYISALLMIAPALPHGLNISLKGDKISSLPYIQLTLDIMEKFGIKYVWQKNTITVKPQHYIRKDSSPYPVESDWSAASYWYALVAVSKTLSVKLNGYLYPSKQGDSAIVGIMEQLGVKTEYNLADKSLYISNQDNINSNFKYDFSNTPDLAQTVIVVCASKGINATFSGLESLIIKETNRIKALQNELAKFGVQLYEDKKNTYRLRGNFKTSDEEILINTYDDHRMAMSFAPLAVLNPLVIDAPHVVEKSYPEFWNHLNQTNIKSKAL